MTTLRSEHRSERIAIYREGQTDALLLQQAAPDHRPFIHPILAPDGVGALTENEPGHHLWQHGLYVGLNDVNGAGFWTEGFYLNPERDGTFHPQALTPPVLDGTTARWEVATDWRSPAGEPLLTETQKWTLEDRGETLALDLDWDLRAQTDLRFGKYAYGGLFLRMPWRAGNRATLLTSEGARTPADAEGKRARWTAVSMPIPRRPQGPAGIALLDHAANPEHPAPWRVDDNYGLCPSRCIAGAWHLASGDVTVSRYRVFVFAGEIVGETIEAEWRKFSGAV